MGARAHCPKLGAHHCCEGRPPPQPRGFGPSMPARSIRPTAGPVLSSWSLQGPVPATHPASSFWVFVSPSWHLLHTLIPYLSAVRPHCPHPTPGPSHLGRKLQAALSPLSFQDPNGPGGDEGSVGPIVALMEAGEAAGRSLLGRGCLTAHFLLLRDMPASGVAL